MFTLLGELYVYSGLTHTRIKEKFLKNLVIPRNAHLDINEPVSRWAKSIEACTV